LAFFAARGWMTAAMSRTRAGHVEALEVELHLAGFDLREVEHGVDQLEEVLAGGIDLLEVVGELLGAEVGGVLLQHLAVADDGVERRAQLVRHVGEELRLVAVGDLELAALVLDLAEQARVLDGDGRLGGEGLEEVHDLRRELPRDFLLTVSPPISWPSRSRGTLSSARVPVRRSTSRSGPVYAPAWAMSGIWTGSWVIAMRPATPSPRRMGFCRAIAVTSSSRLWVARKTRVWAASSYS
jgi:hypothetical protein